MEQIRKNNPVIRARRRKVYIRRNGVYIVLTIAIWGFVIDRMVHLIF